MAAPSRSVLGVVRDKDTDKPLAGVTVETEVAFGEFIRTPHGQGRALSARRLEQGRPPNQGDDG